MSHIQDAASTNLCIHTVILISYTV